MKRIIALVLHFLLIFNLLCVPMSKADASGAVFAATPVLSASAPVIGLNGIHTWVVNDSDENRMVILNAKVYENDTIVREASAQKTFRPNERGRLGLGIQVDSKGQTIKTDVKDSTGLPVELKDYIFLEPVVITTNATDGVSVFDEIYFDVNRPIGQSALDGIRVRSYMSYSDENVEAAVRDLGGGHSRIILNFDSASLLPDTCVTITLPDTICDIFGQSIGENIYTFTTLAHRYEFAVWQKAGVFVQKGTGGLGILATFEEEQDIEIYFERTFGRAVTQPFVPLVLAKVIDPSGNTAAEYDFSDMLYGKKGHLFKIPYKMAGIWQIQFISGNQNDMLSIGIREVKAWGIRGETILGITETTPIEGYVYIPEKVDELYVASTSSNMPISVYDLNEIPLGTSETCNYNFAKHQLTIPGFEQEQIVKVKLNNPVTGNGLIVDIAPSLLCPTPEMADDLKGGWEETEGILVQGALQKLARNELNRLIESKNFVMTFTKPAMTTQLQYPIAEAQLFGKTGTIGSVDYLYRTQNLNVQSPFCGLFVSDLDEEGHTHLSWEGGMPTGFSENTAFAGPVTVDAELNAFYHNDALINRTAVFLLANMSMLSEDLMIRTNKTCETVPSTYGVFFQRTIATCYNETRELFDPQTIEILDKLINAMTDKMSNCYGNGPSNQWLMEPMSIAAAYAATGHPRFKEVLARHIDGIQRPTALLGQTNAGYFIEGSGVDGNYGSFNQNLIYEVYKILKEDGTCPEILSQVRDIIQKELEFNSLFWFKEKGNVSAANHMTSRTIGPINSMAQNTMSKIVDDFPLAKRRMELNLMPSNGPGLATTNPFIINNNEWAYRLINRNYSSYDKTFEAGCSNNRISYEAMKDFNTHPSTLAPIDYESGIWEKDGTIAIKHDGMYMVSMYAHSPASTSSADAYLGGGMSQMWTGNTGSFMVSRKKQNYFDDPSINSSAEVMSTSIFGVLEDEGFYVSGKEKATLTWIEQGKIFEISGTDTASGMTVTWRYELIKGGFKVTVSVSGSASDMWINLPIPNRYVQSKYSPGKVEYEADDGIVTIQVDGNAETVFIPDTNDGISNGYDRLRIALDGQATFYIAQDEQERYGDLIIDDNASYDPVSETLKVSLINTASGLREGKLITACYGSDGSLLLVELDTVSIPIGKTKKITKQISIPTGTDSIKCILWKNDNTSPWCSVRKVENG